MSKFEVVIVLLCLLGCGTAGQKATTKIDAAEGAVVEVETDVSKKESAVEAEEITGDVTTIRYGMDEETAKVEKERIAQAAAERAGVYVIFGALILLALAAPNVFPAALTGAVFIVAIVALLAGALLPNILTLLF